MAETLLSTQTVTSTAAALTFSDADTTNNNYYVNTGCEIVEMVNGGASEATVTVATGATMDGNAIADKTITLSAGERNHIVLKRTDIYNDTSGNVILTCTGDGAADVDFAVFRI